MVHFVTEANGEVRPVCGEWGTSRNWTKVRSAVSCRRCLAVLGDEAQRTVAPAAQPLAQVIALHPRTGA